MNQKQIGIIIVVITVMLSVVIFISQQKESANLRNFVEERGSCFLEDGTCLHERSMTFNIISWVVLASLMMLGVYLVFFDKTQKILASQQEKVSSALVEAKKADKEKDEFSAYLSAFSKDEKNVLKAIHEQDGIQQSTLRYRAGISKTGLSLMLKSLEERDIISRKKSGKTNNVYLRKRF